MNDHYAIAHARASAFSRAKFGKITCKSSILIFTNRDDFRLKTTFRQHSAAGKLKFKLETFENIIYRLLM